MSGPRLSDGANAKRDPRPQDDDGTYRCYHEGCDEAADVVQPWQAESTGYGPVGTVVTYCLRHHLAWEVLDDTGTPVSFHAESVDRRHEEMTSDTSDDDTVPPGYGDDYDYDDAGWSKFRLYARALSNMALYDHPLGTDADQPDDSPFGTMLDHAGFEGDNLREKMETPVEQQLINYGMIDEPDPGEGTELGDFNNE